MNSSIFILCKQKEASIERLHIVTWDIEKKNYYTEYGFEIKRGALKSLDMQISIPLLSNKEDIFCLASNLSNNPQSCRFIFNSDIENNSPINGSVDYGVNVKFKDGREITILPLNGEFEISEETMSLKIPEFSEQCKELIYIRFLVKSSSPPFRLINKELTRKVINYDLRINECRTAPSSVIDLQRKHYFFMSIEKCFCFHIAPISHSIGFLDSKKLKNIRELESKSFEQYLGNIATQEGIKLSSNHYNIIFCKQEKSVDYSFFMVFYKEYISNKQLAVAVFANILCSLLFALSAFRTKRIKEIEWYKQIPMEYCFAIVILIILVLYLFFPPKCLKK